MQYLSEIPTKAPCCKSDNNDNNVTDDDDNVIDYYETRGRLIMKLRKLKF